MSDPTPPPTHCYGCAAPLPSSKGKRGRPRKFCTKPECQAGAKNARRRRGRRSGCRLCRCPLLFLDERMCAVCRPCREGLARVRPVVDEAEVQGLTLRDARAGQLPMFGGSHG